MLTLKFAWLPVRLFEFRSPYFYQTNKISWLKYTWHWNGMFGQFYITREQAVRCFMIQASLPPSKDTKKEGERDL